MAPAIERPVLPEPAARRPVDASGYNGAMTGMCVIAAPLAAGGTVALPAGVAVAVIAVAALLLVLLVRVCGWIAEAATGTLPPWPRRAGALVAGCGWVAATWPPDPALAVLAVPLLVWGVALAHIDARTHRLPDVLVLTAYPFVGAVLLATGITTADTDRLLRAAAAATVALTIVGALALSGGIGFGDAKLAGVLALVLGWLSWAAVMAACLLGLVAALVPALRARWIGGGGARFALGPPLLLGALAAPSW